MPCAVTCIKRSGAERPYFMGTPEKPVLGMCVLVLHLVDLEPVDVLEPTNLFQTFCFLKPGFVT